MRGEGLEELEKFRTENIETSENKAIAKLSLATSEKEVTDILNNFALDVFQNMGLNQVSVGIIKTYIDAPKSKRAEILKDDLTEEKDLLEKAWGAIDSTKQLISSEYKNKTAVKKILDGFVKLCKKIGTKFGISTKITIPKEILNSIKDIKKISEDYSPNKTIVANKISKSR
jgi:hypothetical protein